MSCTNFLFRSSRTFFSISFKSSLTFLKKHEIFSKAAEAVMQRCSTKKSVLRNFTKITVKHLCQSLFLNKVAGLSPATLLKKKLWHRCFPMSFAKLLRKPFSQNTNGWLLLKQAHIWLNTKISFRSSFTVTAQNIHTLREDGYGYQWLWKHLWWLLIRKRYISPG